MITMKFSSFAKSTVFKKLISHFIISCNKWLTYLLSSVKQHLEMLSQISRPCELIRWLTKTEQLFTRFDEIWTPPSSSEVFLDFQILCNFIRPLSLTLLFDCSHSRLASDLVFPFWPISFNPFYECLKSESPLSFLYNKIQRNIFPVIFK